MIITRQARRHARWSMLALTALCGSAQADDTPWRLSTELDAAGYDAALISQAADGYRPISISPRVTTSGVRYQAVWVNDGVTDWQQIHDADAASFTAWINARRAEGYKPDVIAMHGNPIIYAAAVERDLSADWQISVARTSAQLSSDVTLYGDQGYRISSVAAAGSGAAARFSAVWTKDVLGWQTNWAQTASTFATRATNVKDSGGRLLRAAAYGTTASPQFISTWLYAQQPDGWRDHLGQTFAEFTAVVSDMTAQNYRPIDIGAYETPSGTRYNSTWIRQPVPRNWTVTGRPVTSWEMLDDIIREFMQERRAPAASLSVTYHGRLVYSRAFTYAPDGYPITTPENVFRIASVSKPILAVGLLRLVDEGLVNLDDTMVSILGGGWTDLRVAGITVRDLLQHTGGWDRDLVGDVMFNDAAIASALGVPLPIGQNHIIQYQKGASLNHDPGTTFAYSNFGFMLAGRIIETVTGRPYEEYLRDEVFGVLGTDVPRIGDHLGQLPNEVPYSDPQQRRVPSVMDPLRPLVDYCYGAWNQINAGSAAGVVCRTSDLVRFASAFDDPDHSPLLTRERIEEMWARPAYTPAGFEDWYGLGWFVDKVGNASVFPYHDGALPGTMAWLENRPDGVNWALVVNQNSLYTPGMPTNYHIWASIDPFLDSITEWPAGDLWCRVDLNQDGFVDFSDYLDFLNLYDNQSSEVDFNQDGFVDFVDYLEFLNLYDAGC